MTISLIIRKAIQQDYKQIAKVHVDSWRTTYHGIIKESYLQNIKYEDRENLWTSALAEESHHIWVAEVNHKIVGFVSGGRERTNKYGIEGELYAIYILKEFQQKGIGKKLVTTFAEDLKTNGYSSMLVWVLSENPSTLFYQSLKPAVIDYEYIDIGGENHKETAYGWKDLTNLLA
ncbi:GNAT family N-acetyltransferase [Bacillus salitolerans]|uniref:GNAT family N-acetyltransferase n=1 Tax=Bacillus salitolerans TaxID=1437434 RepID=A0ABW4LLF5_9BACI